MAGVVAGAMPGVEAPLVGVEGAPELLRFLDPGFGCSAAVFFVASAARSASICALVRLGFRMRPSRLNLAQWLSMASVRLGFFELAIFWRRASSTGSNVASVPPRTPFVGAATGVAATGAAEEAGAMG